MFPPLLQSPEADIKAALVDSHAIETGTVRLFQVWPRSGRLVRNPCSVFGPEMQSDCEPSTLHRVCPGHPPAADRGSMPPARFFSGWKASFMACMVIDTERGGAGGGAGGAEGRRG